MTIHQRRVRMENSSLEVYAIIYEVPEDKKLSEHACVVHRLQWSFSFVPTQQKNSRKLSCDVFTFLGTTTTIHQL
jgi:hypothetical protein